ncbi:MAG: hypothetical protein ACOC42_01495 [Halobacteriota archaeon]
MTGRLRWFRLEGDTPAERIRRNPLQLAVLLGVTWSLAIGAYVSLVGFFGPLVTSALVLVAAFVLGRRVRRFMLDEAGGDR